MITYFIICLSFVSPESHQVLAQLLDALLVIGSQLPESAAVRRRLVEVARKVKLHINHLKGWKAIQLRF